MLVDHIGYFFLPSVEVLRIIGRLAFPLFGYALVQGERHTSNFSGYLFRLIIFTLISQIPYAIFVRNDRFNIGLELLLALVLLRFDRKLKSLFFKFLIFGLVGITAVVFNSEYDIYGLIAIYLIAHYKNDFWWWFFWSILHIVPMFSGSLTQPFAVVTPLIFRLSNGNKGSLNPWIFYFFYPIHLFLLGWAR